MSDETSVPVPAGFSSTARLDAAGYETLYRQSIEDPDGFWAEQAQQCLDWFSPWEEVQSADFQSGEVRWFSGARLNASYNCLDRHLEEHGERAAIIWQGTDPDNIRTVSYRGLHEWVCRFATALKGLGVKKGNHVCIYLPMIPEVVVAMLACARIGAVHSVVFAGFSPDALRRRIDALDCAILITADQGFRGGRPVPLKANADAACELAESVRRVIVVEHGRQPINWNDARDLWFHELVEKASKDCSAVEVDAEDPLFVLHSSGSTGRPKSVVHNTGGYLLHAAMTHRLVFDHQPDDIHWCTANIGWIAAHTYGVYGPLANAATTVMCEGIPEYPHVGRYWETIARHRVTTFYTAPTVVRGLMRHGNEPVLAHDRSSLRVLGSVGEPLSPKAWHWLHDVVGESRCPLVDTWWQTEAGGILLTTLPGAMPMKPGCVGKPLPGVVPVLVDDASEVQDGEACGHLLLARSWPGQTPMLYDDHDRYVTSFFTRFPGYYHTGDSACRDADGYYRVTGRTDDALTLGRLQLGTAEIENVLVEHPSVAEVAVVALQDEAGKAGLYVYVTPLTSASPDATLAAELTQTLEHHFGSDVRVLHLQWAQALPKTRSGKIMRRILRKITDDDTEHLGDISTLADPSVVDDLVEHRQDS